MTVAWLTGEADALHQQCPTRIQILLPGEQSAFHLVYRVADGPGLRVFVRGPRLTIITARRIECAKDLLRDTEMPVVDVAGSVGFQTQGHLTGVFRKNCGVMPGIYRLHCPLARLQNEADSRNACQSVARTARRILSPWTACEKGGIPSSLRKDREIASKACV
jgi:AraC-like DNA-binding protein